MSFPLVQPNIFSPVGSPQGGSVGFCPTNNGSLVKFDKTSEILPYHPSIVRLNNGQYVVKWEKHESEEAYKWRVSSIIGRDPADLEVDPADFEFATSDAPAPRSWTSVVLESVSNFLNATKEMFSNHKTLDDAIYTNDLEAVQYCLKTGKYTDPYKDSISKSTLTKSEKLKKALQNAVVGSHMVAIDKFIPPSDAIVYELAKAVVKNNVEDAIPTLLLAVERNFTNSVTEMLDAGVIPNPEAFLKAIRKGNLILVQKFVKAVDVHKMQEKMEEDLLLSALTQIQGETKKNLGIVRELLSAKIDFKRPEHIYKLYCQEGDELYKLLKEYKAIE